MPASRDSLGKTKVNNLVDKKIRTSIDRNLAQTGWKQVRRRPDVLLVYDVDVQRENVNVSDAVYSQPLTRWYYNPYRGNYVPMYYPTELLGYNNRTETVHEGTFNTNGNERKYR